MLDKLSIAKPGQESSRSGIAPPSPEDIAALSGARHPDAFAVLGRHDVDGTSIVRTFQPDAEGVEISAGNSKANSWRAMQQDAYGLFSGVCNKTGDYKLRVTWPGGHIQIIDDPYCIGPQLGELDLYLFSQGRHADLPARFGANLRTVDGKSGVLFAVWAPNARSVSVVGDLNSWDARRHPMRLQRKAGVWELFIPGIEAGAIYKYAITAADGRKLPLKADPLARLAECPPKTGSVVAPALDYEWADAAWFERRAEQNSSAAPISVYEVHVTSWLRTYDGQPSNWDDAIERLIPYVKTMGFTHVELMPVAEHPFGGSWGYQPLALFAPTARLGPPEGFARFVDACHAAEIGVIVDWVPAHFPADAHGMAQFDGTALYEHQDPREGFHQDWNTLIYNVGRTEVRGFLIASALWWLKTYHLDGLRVDAVASMLYRDYSRKAGEWVPNVNGGRENLETVEFLKELNTLVRDTCPGAMMIAEESTAWPGITAPVSQGGLGFHFKWNLGWMHDTLEFFERDPIHRRHHMREITFGLVYGFSERFVLSLSHDEVVHGKGSMLAKMPGDDWQRFANLRLCLAMMFTHPGKKLLFMGIEFGQETEWKVDDAFPWPHGGDHRRSGLMQLVADVNALYRNHAALHELDHSPDGFRWVVESDPENTVFAFLRSNRAEGEEILVVANMTPVPRPSYRIGVPYPGRWHEVLNSDSERYAGSNVGNLGGADTQAVGMHEFSHSIEIVLPPLGLVVFARTLHS